MKKIMPQEIITLSLSLILTMTTYASQMEPYTEDKEASLRREEAEYNKEASTKTSIHHGGLFFRSPALDQTTQQEHNLPPKVYHGPKQGVFPYTPPAPLAPPEPTMQHQIILSSPIKQDPITQGFTLKIGEKNSFALKSNRSTGYSWRLKSCTPNYENQDIVSISEPEYIQNNDSTTIKVGQNGRDQFMITAQKSGTVTCNFEYVRPWEKNVTPVNTQKVVIEITE